MNDPTPKPQYSTKCKICGHLFMSSAFVPLIGDQIDDRRRKMAQVLLNHLATQHMNLMQAIVIIAGFQFSDPVILQEMEPYRWQVHQNTSAKYVDDAQLEHQLTGAGLDSEQIAIVKELRDLLTETGPHAVLKQAPQPAEPLIQS